MDENIVAPKASPDAGVLKKYIRTFEGDMEAMQKGAVPDLAPLKSPAAAEPTPVPVTPAPSSIVSDISLPPVPPSPLFKTPPPAEKPVSNPPETYSGDFTDRMKEENASTATVLAAEQDSGPRAPEPPQNKSALSSILYVVVGVILVAAGGVGAYIAYQKYLSASEPIVVLAPAVSTPIFVDDRQQVSGNGNALMQAVEQSAARSLTASTVRLLYFFEMATSTASVFSALQLPAPGALLRNIVTAPSMAGIVNVGSSQSPFFILSVASYSNTFAGMLQWEARMPRDLAKLFPSYPAPAVTSVATSTVSTASTTKTQATTSIISAPALAFRDETIANHDVRVYRDSLGRSVVLYGYWNPTTLVIARNEAAFSEILKRLSTSRAQ